MVVVGLGDAFDALFVISSSHSSSVRSMFSSAQPQDRGEQRAAHFRTESPSNLQSSVQPQTGLGILMTGGVSSVFAPGSLLNPAPSPTPVVAGTVPYAHLTPNQHARIQEDLADRERQAGALAAAGMVAESVNFTRASTVVGQILQAPPPLVGMPPPGVHASSLGPPLESINWNFDLGSSALAGGVDDMDVDFAALFDTEEEHSLMMQGSMAPSPPPGATGPTSHPSPTDIHGTPNPLNTAL